MQPASTSSAKPVALPQQPTKGLAQSILTHGHGALLTELYYDDQTSYLGCVDADSTSDISDVDTVTGEICSSTDIASMCDDCEYAAVTEKPRYGDCSASPTHFFSKATTDGAAYPENDTNSRGGVRARSLYATTTTTTTTRRRNDPYAFRVLPIACYAYIDPASLAEIVTDDPETVVGGRWDAGDALIDDLAEIENAELGSSFVENWRLVYDGEGPHPVDPVNGPYPAPVEASHSEQQLFAPTNAASTSQPNVMCCYWKQGHCQMGDACWYSHAGSDETPCHYGASCRKGHRQLVRSNPNIPAAMTRRTFAPVHVTGRYGVETTPAAAAAYAPPRRYVHEPKPAKPSAPLTNSEKPCPHCGAEDSVRMQEFPLYEGNRCRMATRGHCTECKRTFMMQQQQ